MGLSDRLGKLGATAPTKGKKSTTPLWSGPQSSDSNGGVTFSLLSRWLCCRERFRVLVCEGLTGADTFNHRLHYGLLWHVAEEALAKCKPPASTKWKAYVDAALAEYGLDLCKQYPMQQDQINHWYSVCKAQFPIYVQYWEKHPDVVDRVPLLQEVSFKVSYTLPSGRTVLLRGKWDSVDLVGKGSNAGVFLKENKTKGEINEKQLKEQLSSGFDAQTMIYLTALEAVRSQYNKTGEPEWITPIDHNFMMHPLRGITYNVVRRPLSGGKGSIVQHKPTKSNPKGETKDHFYKRLAGIIEEDPGSYFMRWRIEVSSEDIQRFRRECLDPILEQLCDWWEWVKDGQDPFRYEEGGVYGQYKVAPSHFRFPYGCYNPILEGGSTEMDEYLNTGSTLGLRRCESLFPELE